MKAATLTIWSLLLLLPDPSIADVSLPKLISDGMVLQRDSKINIWGWALGGEKIVVKFKGRACRAVTSPDGQWKTTIAPTKAGGPFSMEINGYNSIILHDILVGDVWFCTGQSNMVSTMERVKAKNPTDIQDPEHSKIRIFRAAT